jgi:hypothetical protein
MGRSARRTSLVPGRAQVGVAQGGVHAIGGSRTAHERAEPREQLRKSERLRQVVVGAGVEPGHTAVDLRASGEHEHGNGIPVRTQAPADLETVDPRHEDVEDDRVGLHALVQP